MKNKPTYQKNAMILSCLILLALLSCIAWICFSKPTGPLLIADIYQDGRLIQSIDLHSVETPYTFVMEGTNHCVNEIEVRQGSIGILSASCPDKLCVHQGFIHNSQLPITCLPNHLVIQIRTTDNEAGDIITY